MLIKTYLSYRTPSIFVKLFPVAQKPENQVRTASEKEAAGNPESRPQTRSRTSTLNSLELPPRDLREECWVAASEEEMMYLRKRDRVVLEKANTRKWVYMQMYYIQKSIVIEIQQTSLIQSLNNGTCGMH